MLAREAKKWRFRRSRFKKSASYIYYFSETFMATVRHKVHLGLLLAVNNAVPILL